MFTQIAISTLQNNRLNKDYYLILDSSEYLCTFAPRKITFASVFYNVVCARTLYIGETPKSVLFAVYRLFLAY